jgi:hypothetical protein
MQLPSPASSSPTSSYTVGSARTPILKRDSRVRFLQLPQPHLLLPPDWLGRLRPPLPVPMEGGLGVVPAVGGAPDHTLAGWAG